MTRSYYHTPIMGDTGRSSCKKWRQLENKKYRAYSKNLIRHENYDNLVPYKHKWGNEWTSPRDGKTYFGACKYIQCIDRKSLPDWGWFQRGAGCWLDKDIHYCSKEYKRLMRK